MFCCSPFWSAQPLTLTAGVCGFVLEVSKTTNPLGGTNNSERATFKSCNTHREVHGVILKVSETKNPAEGINCAHREKMPFHHVTAGLLYKGNYLNRSLSAGSDSEQLANISVEELDEIREAFRVLDRDGNGFISKQELGMAMRSLGYMPSEVELAIIMQRLDMDGDGQVDFDEFMTILGPKLVSSEGRDGFLGNTIDSIFWQQEETEITVTINFPVSSVFFKKQKQTRILIDCLGACCQTVEGPEIPKTEGETEYVENTSLAYRKCMVELQNRISIKK
ncbi:calcium-binding protein 8 isoform X2 [Hylobates moloch]|uniref:calcium-binding protein 8 isoform X2 n=1 Tax=Hylobates moloch TaxID=81572 RepID=UPI002674407D|nr:calcium-binding protein 8 isoform X2 [Hylobates moloch]